MDSGEVRAKDQRVSLFSHWLGRNRKPSGAGSMRASGGEE